MFLLSKSNNSLEDGGPSHPNHIHQYALWSLKIVACYCRGENDEHDPFWDIKHALQNAYVF